MNYIEHLQHAIKEVHGCESEHVETVSVVETFEGKVVWQGEVEVFNLSGHPKAKRCYAWAYNKEVGSDTVAVLELPPVISPITAVRATIASRK